MEKKTYIKPETTWLHMETDQLMVRQSTDEQQAKGVDMMMLDDFTLDWDFNPDGNDNVNPNPNVNVNPNDNENEN